MTHRTQYMGLAATIVAGLVLAAPASAFEKHDWLVRGRIVHADPHNRTGEVSGFPGSSMSMDANTSLDFDATFFPLRRLGLETMVTLTNHELMGEDAFKSMGEAADVDAFTSTFCAQWHPMPGKLVQPYLGGGFHHTMYHGEDASAALELALGGPTHVDMESSWGMVAQAGMDIRFAKNWCVNVDVKYMDMDNTMRFRTTTPTGMANQKMDTSCDPWVVGTGIGYRF